MMSFVLTLFTIVCVGFLFLLFLGLTLFDGLLRLLGFRIRRNPFSRPPSSSSSASPRPDAPKEPAQRKVFDDNEGEYVDFEEV